MFPFDDLFELALAAALIGFAFMWRRGVALRVERFAGRTRLCMGLLAALPVLLWFGLRLPIPVPDIYDEFSHLLVADTLRHLRFANPVHPFHRFFETFFVLQEPSYSSIYPIGQGLILSVGRVLFGHPWAGVALSTSASCALCYWMLRGWTTPGWALLGGVLAVCQFGPLNPWMNSYWGGAAPAAAGCLVFGALPRLPGRKAGILLGLGLAIHLLIRPYESIFLLLSVALYLVRSPRTLAVSLLVALPAVGIIAAQNKQVTGSWTRLPYSVSQYEYGVPAALTFQAPAEPHRELTPEQALGYKMQRNFGGGSYWARLGYRVRFYRFFFLPPLFVALIAFVFRLREKRFLWLASTVAIFAAGVNFFPAWQYHYVAAETCLFVLMSVAGLEQLSRLNAEAARILVLLTIAHFAFQYARQERRVPERRIDVTQRVAREPGRLLVFVQYGPRHIFQEEWVWNEADIDAARVVWARDLGGDENAKLTRYYSDRKVFALDADVRPLPLLSPYRLPAPAIAAPPLSKPATVPATHPELHFEPVPQAPR